MYFGDSRIGLRELTRGQQQMKIWYGKHLGYFFGVFLFNMMGSSKSEILCELG